MQVAQFECPHCTASLKIREQDLAGKPVDCPECHKPIVVRVDQAGNVVARKPVEPSAKLKKPVGPPPVALGERKASATASPTQARMAAKQEQPTAGKIATVAAGRPLPLAVPLIGVAVVGLGVAAVILWPRARPVESTTSVPPIEQSEPKPAEKKAAVPAPPAKPVAQVPTAANAPRPIGRISGSISQTARKFSRRHNRAGTAQTQ